MSRRWLPRRPRGSANDAGGLTCRELVELVTDYLEGALSESERARFEAHIAHCDNCTAYVEQMRDTISIVGTIAPGAVGPEMERALLAAFRNWKAEEGP